MPPVLQIRSLLVILCILIGQQSFDPLEVSFSSIKEESQGGNVLDPDPARQLFSEPSTVALKGLLAKGRILSRIKTIINVRIAQIPGKSHPGNGCPGQKRFARITGQNHCQDFMNFCGDPVSPSEAGIFLHRDSRCESRRTISGKDITSPLIFSKMRSERRGSEDIMTTSTNARCQRSWYPVSATETGNRSRIFASKPDKICLFSFREWTAGK